MVLEGSGCGNAAHYGDAANAPRAVGQAMNGGYAAASANASIKPRKAAS